MEDAENPINRVGKSYKIIFMRKIIYLLFIAGLFFNTTVKAQENCLLFGGSKTHYFKSSLNLNNYLNLTISAWVKPGTNSSYSIIFSNDNQS